MRRAGRRYPLVGPDVRDPRLHVALVVVSVQALGQTVLHFDISIAQILIAITTCAVIELWITVRRYRLIAWPASALLTGNGVALILRVPGTRHGDWWSLKGGWIFAAVAAVSLLSKYLIRVDGRPLFNPSNFGLVLGFLVLGSRRVDPLDFWWVRPGPALAVALSVIIAGGLVLAWRVKMLGLIVSFWLTYAAALGVLAARGHCITARWHVGPVCNGYFWTVLVTSPEVLVFMFFMITDPKTVPRGRTARNVYGAAIALVFVALAAPQQTEYATKVALLGALALVCAARPLLERLSPAQGTEANRLGTALEFVHAAPNDAATSQHSKVGHRVQRVAVLTVVAVVYAAIVVGAGTPARTSSETRPAPSTPANCTNRAATSSPRPRPTVRAVALPTVTVRGTINVATAISTQTARQIVRGVIDDLAIAADAIDHQDPRVATDIARFPWLDDLITAICSTSGPLVVSTYQFTHATVTIAKRATGQVFPEIDVELQGEIHERTITRSKPRLQLREHITPYRHTLVVTKAGGYWLICGYRSDPRTSACVTAT
jgi:Na+-translocating ferredoxin:NAD+ oxidoreductase RnfD subunit